MPSQALKYIPRPEDARAFFRVLTHDDRDSRYIVARCDGKKWTERSFSADELIDFFPDSGDDASYYVTRNGFTGRRREQAFCRQVNALMFDIDCHGADAQACVPEVVAVLAQAYDDGTLPRPTLWVYTGRGVQAYYVFDKSTSYRRKSGLNDKGLGWIKRIEDEIAMAYEEVMGAVPEAEVDGSVYDLSRVGRIPGTYNPKAADVAMLLEQPGRYYSMEELSRMYPKGESRLFKKAEKKAAGAKQRKGRILGYDKLMLLRLKKIEELQAFRSYDCEGRRELMSFVYYNTATQIYGPQRAFELLQQFNNRFKSRLKARELQQIKASVDGNVVPFGRYKGRSGFFIIGAKKLVEKLGMTQAEMAAIGFFANKRSIEREEAKEATRARRQARDKKIESLHLGSSMTRKQIAEAAGCSVRTVATVIARLKQKLRESTTRCAHVTLETRTSVLAGVQFGAPLPFRSKGALNGVQNFGTRVVVCDSHNVFGQVEGCRGFSSTAFLPSLNRPFPAPGLSEALPPLLRAPLSWPASRLQGP